MVTSQTVLIAVKSPLQAFNAIEYHHYLKTQGVSLKVYAIVFCSARKPQLADLLSRLLAGIDSVTLRVAPVVPGEKGWWYSLSERKPARRFSHTLASILSSMPAPDEIVIGDYRSRECRHLAAQFPAARIVLLDDGSATHQIARFRRNPRDPKLAPMFPHNDLRSLRLKMWAGITLPPIRHLTFFSHYAINLSPHDHLIPHHYEFWRSRLAGRQHATGDEILFLGMSHVEKKLTTRECYLESLQKIKEFYQERRVVYRPHRDESAEKLADVAGLGFIVSRPDLLPVELSLIESSALPAEVASIASSALDNLAIIFSNSLTLRCFTPGAKYCDGVMNGHFSDIIHYHIENRHNNLKVVGLELQATR
ncbi:MAG: hypothetical protein K0R17_2033 [Rariglobus sp.]|jgi:hypothetical protein|nr:hypothetical protein [Rariglobus sp.]